MATVQLAKNVTIDTVVSMRMSNIELNVVMAVMDGDKDVSGVIDKVRRTNRPYKFVEVDRFYNAITRLVMKGIVIYHD